MVVVRVQYGHSFLTRTVHWLIWLVLQAQIVKKGAGLLQGSCSSVVRASTAKVGGLGFDSLWLPLHFFFSMFLS